VELWRTAPSALRLGLAISLGVNVVLVVLPLGNLERVGEALDKAVADRLRNGPLDPLVEEAED
jgi:hypothetical protein